MVGVTLFHRKPGAAMKRLFHIVGLIVGMLLLWHGGSAFAAAEPRIALVGNGVVARFNRTLKEQVIHGRVYRNLVELRNAVRQFVDRYNAQWLVEKNGFLSPNHAREQWNAARSVRPAA